MNYSRIKDSIDIGRIQKAHVVIVGAGGSYSLITGLARTGIRSITVIDFDVVEDTNIVRQGYKQSDIGKYKVDALQQEVLSINPNITFNGINKNFLKMTDKALDDVFQNADLLLFLTDSFKAQAFGNTIALQYNKAAIWAGWYAKSRTAEVFFQAPGYSTACFRCCASSRYQANEQEEVKISSNSNTIFHSQSLDAFLGMLTLALLHLNNPAYTNNLSQQFQKEYEVFVEAMKTRGRFLEYNFFQFKAHPKGGNRLFDNAFGHLQMQAHNFNAYWQKVDAELKVNGYDYDCPDCQGKLHHMVQLTKK